MLITLHSRRVPKSTAAAKITPLQSLAAFLAGLLLKALARTLRVEWKDAAGCYSGGRTRPVIICIWHNRILGAILCDYRAARARRIPLSVLTSASKDGGWLAAIARKFRMGAVRGSSSRRGAAAVLEISRHIGGGGDIAITPDGPRGPNYSIAPGVIYLAQHAGVGIVPMEVQISRYWRIGKRWDALWIPKPFSRVSIVFHPALEIVGTMEEESARLNTAMGPK